MTCVKCMPMAVSGMLRGRYCCILGISIHQDLKPLKLNQPCCQSIRNINHNEISTSKFPEVALKGLNAHIMSTGPN